MGKNFFVYESWLTDQFQHDHVFLHPDLLDDKVASFAALMAHSLVKQIPVLSQPNKDQEMVVYYSDDENLLVVMIDDKTAITMKINPRAFGVKRMKQKKE